MSYIKPIVRSLDDQTGACGCNVFYRATQGGACGINVGDTTINVNPVTAAGGPVPCVSVDAGQVVVGDPRAITVDPVFSNTIVGVNDGGAQVTPLAGTGLPGTQPIYVGAPVGTHGIAADVQLFRAAFAIDPHAFGATVAGQTVIVGLPLLP